jgi:hypothetical protein
MKHISGDRDWSQPEYRLAPMTSEQRRAVDRDARAELLRQRDILEPKGYNHDFGTFKEMLFRKVMRHLVKIGAVQHMDGAFYNDLREPFVVADLTAISPLSTAVALYTPSAFPVLGGQYFARPGKAFDAFEIRLRWRG